MALREEREPLCFGASEIVVTKDRSPTYEYLGPEVTHVITHRNEATCNLKAFAFPLSMHHQSDCCSARAPFGAGTACACYTPLSCKWSSHGAATLPVDLPARPWARSQKVTTSKRGPSPLSLLPCQTSSSQPALPARAPSTKTTKMDARGPSSS